MSNTNPMQARRRRARIMRMLNRPMRLMLSARFPTPAGRRLMLAHLTGRRTGRHYRQPLSYIRDGEDLLTPGGGRWTANVSDGRPVLLRINGHDVTATPEVVRDPAEVEALLDRMAAASPGTARFVPLPRTADGRLEAEPLREAIRYGFGIVRWHVRSQPALVTGG